MLNLLPRPLSSPKAKQELNAIYKNWLLIYGGKSVSATVWSTEVTGHQL